MGSLFDGTKHMDEIEKIYKQMEDNCPAPRSTSQKLWELRRKCDIAPHHRAPETMLEKAVATLAASGHMPDWYNQCPVASGITVSSMSRQASQATNKKSNVDLVHWDTANKHARLVELKWGSDDPLSALMQILRYGATYIFCRVHRNALPLRNRPLMDARHVSLEVVAPRRFYNGSNERDRFTRTSKALDALAASKTGGTVSMSLKALAFPDKFQIPFTNGGEVKSKCATPQATAEGQAVHDAFDDLTQVWP